MKKRRTYMCAFILIVGLYGGPLLYGIPSAGAQSTELCTDINAINHGEPLPCDIPLDLCPNRSGSQSSIPPGFIIDANGHCTEFICEDPLANNTDGYFLCTYDICPYNEDIFSNHEDCVPPIICEDEEATNFEEEGECIYPPVDICPNIDGIQETIPDGYILDGDDCILEPDPEICIYDPTLLEDDEDCVPPIDLCPNRSGYQSAIPPGFTTDENGHCVEMVCPYDEELYYNDLDCVEPDPEICEEEDATNFEEEGDCIYDEEPPIPPLGGGGGGGGGGGLTQDYCPEGDFSGSYYDRECGEAPTTEDETDDMPTELLETGPIDPPTDTPPTQEYDLPKELLTTGAKSHTTMLYLLLAMMLIVSILSTTVLLDKKPTIDKII